MHSTRTLALAVSLACLGLATPALAAWPEAKESLRNIGRDAKEFGKEYGHAMKDTGRRIGHGTRDTVHEVGRGFKRDFIQGEAWKGRSGGNDRGPRYGGPP